MSGAVWWSSSALTGYLGLAPKDGLEWRRHDALMCAPGFWAVYVTGWGMQARAVVDDFGDLVRVKEPMQ